MASTKSPSNSLPDNLPLLTQVVETDMPDDLPMLTDIVADIKDEQLAGFAIREAEASIEILDSKSQSLTSQQAAALAPREFGEEELQQILHYLEEHIETILPEPEIPPPRVLGERELQQVLDYLKARIESILPEPVAPPPRVLDEGELQQVLDYLKARIETILPKPVAPPPRVLSKEELQQILHHLEARLDAMLASKLSLHFEKLRDALNAHLDSRIQ